MDSFLRSIVGGAAASLVGGAAMYFFLQASPAHLGAAAPNSEVEAVAAVKREMAQLRRAVQDLQLEGGKPLATDRPEGDRDDLRAEVEDLKALVASLVDHQQQAALRQAGNDAGSVVFEEDAWDEPRDQEEDMAVAEEEVRLHFSMIEDAYRAEVLDHAWGAAVVGRAQDAFAGDETLAGVTLSEIDCRSSRCRLEIWFDGEEVDSSDVELALAENMAGETPRMAIHYLEEDGSGAGSAVVYLARKGYGLMP